MYKSFVILAAKTSKTIKQKKKLYLVKIKTNRPIST